MDVLESNRLISRLFEVHLDWPGVKHQYEVHEPTERAQ